MTNRAAAGIHRAQAGEGVFPLQGRDLQVQRLGVQGAVSGAGFLAVDPGRAGSPLGQGHVQRGRGFEIQERGDRTLRQQARFISI